MFGQDNIIQEHADRSTEPLTLFYTDDNENPHSEKKTKQTHVQKHFSDKASTSNPNNHLTATYSLHVNWFVKVLSSLRHNSEPNSPKQSSIPCTMRK